MTAWLPAYVNGRIHLLIEHGIGATMNSHDCDDIEADVHQGCCDRLADDTYICKLNGVIHTCRPHGQSREDEVCPYIDRRQILYTVVCCHTSHPVYLYMSDSEKKDILQTATEHTLGEKDRRYMKSQLRSQSTVKMHGQIRTSAPSHEQHDLCNVSDCIREAALSADAEERRVSENTLKDIYGLRASAVQPESNLYHSSILSAVVADMDTMSSKSFSTHRHSPPPPAPPIHLLTEHFEVAWLYEPARRCHFFNACHLLPRYDTHTTNAPLASFCSKIPYASSTIKSYCAIQNCVPQDYFWEWYTRQKPLAECSPAAAPLVQSIITENARAIDYHLSKYARCIRKACPVKANSVHTTGAAARRDINELKRGSGVLESPSAQSDAGLVPRYKQPDLMYTCLHRDIISMHLSGTQYLESHVFEMAKLVTVSDAPDYMRVLVFASRFMQSFAQLKKVRRDLDAMHLGSEANKIALRVLSGIVAAIDDELTRVICSMDQSRTNPLRRRARHGVAVSTSAADSDLSLGQLAQLLSTERSSGLSGDLHLMLQRPTFLQICFFMIYTGHLRDSANIDDKLYLQARDFARLYSELSTVLRHAPMVMHRMGLVSHIHTLPQHPVAYDRLHARLPLLETSRGQTQKRKECPPYVPSRELTSPLVVSGALKSESSSKLPPAKRRRVDGALSKKESVGQ